MASAGAGAAVSVNSVTNLFESVGRVIVESPRFIELVRPLVGLLKNAGDVAWG